LFQLKVDRRDKAVSRTREGPNKKIKNNPD